MGKRSEYVRKERDFYPTPFDAYKPLIEHLPKEQFGFAEPFLPYLSTIDVK